MTPAMMHLLDVVRELHVADTRLSDFAPFPQDMHPDTLRPCEKPATKLAAQWPLSGTQATDAVVNAIRDAAYDAHWLQAYTEEEVGTDFINRHNYFELYGPSGAFRTNACRGYISYWGAGLNYGWHQHMAEELYVILSGEAEFFAQGEKSAQLQPGDIRLHLSNQPHAMITHEQPLLTYIIWRGEGLADLPRMSAS